MTAFVEEEVLVVVSVSRSDICVGCCMVGGLKVDSRPTACAVSC